MGGSGAGPMGIHPSRLAAMGGLPGSGSASPGAMTRSAEDAQMDAEPIPKRPRIERPEGHYYPVSVSFLSFDDTECLTVGFCCR